MKDETPFNPLDKRNLGINVADALLAREIGTLPPIEVFIGAGVYAIYYSGDHPAYNTIAERNRGGKNEAPIYVGKAVPAGARKGGFGLGLSPGTVLFNRLVEHASSIKLATNLDLSHFSCRYLVVEDIWIPLAESLLIERFQPAWNRLIDGFGNHAPGKGRYNQQKSRWDTLHRGRGWAEKLPDNSKSEPEILGELRLFLAGILTPPPIQPSSDDDEPG